MINQPATFQSASLYVGDLHPEVTESVLFDMFNRCGPVASIRVCRDTITKRSLGYAYVNFHSFVDAERAIDTMNFTDIKGRPCRIMWSQRDPSVLFGNILSIKVAMDENGQSKGYGYIHYDSAEAAQEAISKFHGNSIDDNTVEVVPFVRRAERSNQANWTNTYLKQFPKSWNEENIKDLVSPYGDVASVAIMRDPEGNSKGFGFVNFSDHESAANAVDALSKYVIEEGGTSYNLYIGRAQKKNERHRELQSQFAQKREEKLNLYQGRNLYVKNIDDDVTDEELLKIFSEHGPVANAKIMRDNSSGSKGFGFVCYNSAEDAQKAINALNGVRIRSKPLVVTLHQRKDVRRVHLQQSSSDRLRFMPPSNMPQVQYMMVANGTGGNFPRQPFYGNPQEGFPGRGPAPRGPVPMRGAYYPVPQYGVPGQVPPSQSQQQPQQPQPGQQQQQQMKRYAPNAGPVPVQQQQVPAGAPRGMPGPRGTIPNGPTGPRPVSGPYPVAGQAPGRGQVPQGMMMQPGVPGQPMPGYPGQPRGPPQMAIKYTNQVRNQPMGIQHGMAQPMEAQQMVMQQMPMQQPFDPTVLAQASLQDQKNMIGERLYPLVHLREPSRAGKITGMLLEMEIAELLNLIESADSLESKVREAIMVLEQHERGLDA